MPVFQSRTPRHRAQSSFRLGRTAILAVAGGALALSSVAPAHAAPAATPQQLVSTQSQSGKAATIATAGCPLTSPAARTDAAMDATHVGLASGDDR